MPAPCRHFVDGPYGQMHVRVAAPKAPTRRPLVLLHMFPQSGRNFERLAEAASVHRIVVAPDFPGYGESDAPPEPIEASDYARSIGAVIDALSLADAHGSVDLFGIHAGAKLAVEVARQRPSGIHRLVLCSAAALTSEEVAGLRKTLAPVPLDVAGTRFQYLWDLLLRNRGPEQSLEELAVSLAEMLRSGEGFGWGHRAVFDYNESFTSVLQSLDHPVALLNPNDDLFAMTPRTRPFLKRGVYIERTDWHSGFLEAHAEEVAQTIESFLTGELDDESAS